MMGRVRGMRSTLERNEAVINRRRAIVGLGRGPQKTNRIEGVWIRGSALLCPVMRADSHPTPLHPEAAKDPQIFCMVCLIPACLPSTSTINAGEPANWTIFLLSLHKQSASLILTCPFHNPDPVSPTFTTITAVFKAWVIK